MSFERSYRFADAVLRLSTDDAALAQRFEDVYSECAAGDDETPALRCCVESDGAIVRVTFDRQFDDLERFIAFIFPERSFANSFATILPGGTMELEASAPWQSFAANVAFNLTLRLQKTMLFFHGATSDVGGRGVMLTGAKASGKTTTSLALAARGHALLGDEVAAVRRESWEAVPFRRALSIRDGIRARGIDEALASAANATEIFPDGQPRIRVRASELFAEQPHAVPLRAAFFLRGFAPQPRFEPVARDANSLRLLQPLGCTLWNNDGHHSTMDLLRFFERTRCYHLDAGAPDDTAAAIERLMEETWP